MSRSAHVGSKVREASTGCLSFAILIFSAAGYAQPAVEELARLDFGVVAITGNSVVSTLEIPRSGSNVSASGAIVPVEPGQPARYRLTGLPATTSVQIDVSTASLSAGGTGIPERLTVSDYDVSSGFTDEAGKAEIVVGATFSTSGNGGSYEDAPYSGSAQLQLTYWEPDLNDFTTLTTGIIIEGDVSTALAIEELKSLSFGTLYARGAVGDVASIRLQPDGKVELSNAGNARVIPLSPSTPGAFRVAGAAPFRSLSVEVQSSNVQLTHTQNPTESLHFVLSDLETTPSLNGTTDKNGRLDVSLGGTLSTELKDAGDSRVYLDGTYRGSYELTITY